MTATKFLTLGDAVLDEHFPAVDLALRRGRHVDRDDAAWFGFLTDALDVLEPFYRRFGAELVYRADGYYYLLPTGDKLAKRQLGIAEMLVGQALTLLYLDPTNVEQGGRVTREHLLAHLATVMGTDALVRALNPKRRRYDERVAQETVRARVGDALRRLATLGFVEAVGSDEIKLRPALMRFVEPVRAAGDSSEALARLVASGELALAPLDAVPEAEDDGSDDNTPADAGADHDVDAEDEEPVIDTSEFDGFGFESVERAPRAENAGENGDFAEDAGENGDFAEDAGDAPLPDDDAGGSGNAGSFE